MGFSRLTRRALGVAQPFWLATREDPGGRHCEDAERPTGHHRDRKQSLKKNAQVVHVGRRLAPLGGPGSGRIGAAGQRWFPDVRREFLG